MSRLATRFQQLAEAGRKALIPYLVAGDPVPEVTVSTMHRLVEAGADVIELGVPFSDPMSEGPVIQLAHERALTHGISLRNAIAMVAEFRRDDPDTPVLLMGYANPVEHMGYPEFVDEASAAGVDALLTVDLPPEEVEPVSRELKRADMDNIFLVSPTTPDDRVGRIVGQASGFIYYVAVKGVTGAGNLDVDDVARNVARIRAHSPLPVAVGFGIKDAASARSVADIADAVVVGSALVNTVAQAVEAGDGVDAGIEAAVALLAAIREGIDAAAA
ncbi:MAG: tryptophan synthase subunit alpha [Pseudomonadota bacterium]